MNRRYCTCRGKGQWCQIGRTSFDALRLLFSVATLHCVLLFRLPASEGYLAPPRNNTHFTILVSSARHGVQGGKCNINSPLYYVLIRSSSWLLHMTCPVICIAPASRFLISQSLSTEVPFFFFEASLILMNYFEGQPSRPVFLSDMQEPYMTWYKAPV